jgi:hypothetical protein
MLRVGELFQKPELAERVVRRVPVDVLDPELGGMVEIGSYLFGRAEQRPVLVHGLGGDVAVHLKHDRQCVGVVPRIP